MQNWRSLFSDSGRRQRKMRLERLESRELLAADLYQLVKDVAPTSFSSKPELLTQAGDKVFFTADDGFHGKELWLTDGTSQGTRLVKDIHPGTDGLIITSMIGLGDQVIFIAYDNVSGSALWQSDGTASGTVPISEFAGVPANAVWSDVYAAGDHVYVVFDDGIHGAELWGTDGTPAGFQLIADIVPGTGSTELVSATAVGDEFFFSAYDGAGSVELWKSNGTSAGTERVKHIDAAASYFVDNLASLHDRVYFTVQRSTGYQLWSSDGTDAGTIAEQLPAGLGASSLTGLYAAGENLYLATTDAFGLMHLWTSPGPAAGWTSLDAAGVAWSSIDSFLQVGAITYFVADDAASGRELWKTAGTAASTALVLDIQPGTASSYRFELVNYASTLYFAANDYLWKSDGTSAGTVMVKSDEGVELSTRRSVLVANDRLYFDAAGSPHGIELWSYDSSNAYPKLLKDINYINVSASSTRISDFVSMGGVAYFFANNVNSSNDTHLMRSDGTVEGTYQVSDVRVVDYDQTASDLVVMDGILYFYGAADSNPGGLWRSDGTAEGTYQVKELNNLVPQKLTVVNSTLYFTTNSRQELWMSDGTEAGTILLYESAVSQSAQPLKRLFAGGELLYFVNYTTTAELWRTDGTAAGTFQLASQLSDIHYRPNYEFANLGDITYFSASSTGNGSELWRTDGTVAGTYQITDARPGPVGSAPLGVINFGGVLYYVTEQQNLSTLWRTDGTAEGTMLIATLAHSGVGYADAKIIDAGSRLFIFVNEELWTSDGTEAGTIKLLSDTTNFSREGVGRNGRLYFAGTDATHGRELWSSDGTVSGTQMVADFMPGTAQGQASYGFIGIFVGDILFFQNRDPIYGEDLWLGDFRTPGDGNNDGLVDGADYVLWADQFMQPPTSSLTFSQGDYNRDGIVDGADYVIWADHFNPAPPEAAAPIIDPVVEPVGESKVLPADDLPTVVYDLAVSELDDELLGWIAMCALGGESFTGRVDSPNRLDRK